MRDDGHLTFAASDHGREIVIPDRSEKCAPRHPDNPESGGESGRACWVANCGSPYFARLRVFGVRPTRPLLMESGAAGVPGSAKKEAPGDESPGVQESQSQRSPGETRLGGRLASALLWVGPVENGRGALGGLLSFVCRRGLAS